MPIEERHEFQDWHEWDQIRAFLARPIRRGEGRPMGARTALLSPTLSSRCGKRGEKLAGLSC